MKRTFIVLVVVGAIAGGYLLGRQYAMLVRPFKGFDGAERFVEIAPGTPGPAIGRTLVEAGIVHDDSTFRLALWLSGEARRLQSGEYRFDRPLTPLQVVRKIARGDVFLLSITFPEGLRIDEMAEIFERAGFGSAASFREAAGDPAAISALDPDATDLEGYLFPETYRVPRHVDAAALVRIMVDGFKRALSPTLVATAQSDGFSIRELVTLASLIEKETGRVDERDLVSAVYRNRLRIGMGLQCDPTVIYALVKAGRYDGNLTRDTLMFDSPYNTYRYPGLPPGPIASPGRAALEAAVRPAEASYLYFVSRNDGSHVFANTLREHNRNVQEHQVRYFRERRRRAREEARASSPR